MADHAKCPNCGGRIIDPRHSGEHSAMHLAAHHVVHHPILAALGFAAAGISKLLPKEYRCADCGRTFRG